MAEFDDKLSAILSNPDIMGQIMSMANAMGQSAPAPQSAPQPVQQAPQRPSAPVQQQDFGLPFDPGAMAGMMDLLKRTQIGERERNLIRALRGFVPDDRLTRLEKAMQASRIARYASSAMQKNQGR